MKLTVKSLTETQGTFLIEDVTPSHINAIRRTLLAEVPKMAVEEVTVYDNTSALFDEMIAHRVGLIPIPTDLQLFVARDQCTCNGEGCANCTILYTLSKEGPCMVVSGDLTPADPRFRIKDDHIPIVKLLEGQRLMLEAAAILGVGRTHAKWIPVTAVGYRELPSVEIKGGNVLPATYARLQKSAPPGSVAFEDGHMKVIDQEKAYDLFKSALAAPGFEDLADKVLLKTDPTKFLLRIETDGALSVKDAMVKAINLIMEKLKVVEQEVSTLKKEIPA